MTDPAAFRSALLDPDAPAPPGLTAPGGRPAGKRFDVYRNNVAVSLSEALETGFPVTRRIVGAAFFRAMAGVFLRAHPPRSPLLMLYGAELPAFLDGFPPALGLTYLSDIARLEYALRRAYHAADAAPLAPQVLQTLPPDRLMRARLGLAPAVQVIRSAHPVHAIWSANADAGPVNLAVFGPQNVLVTRPDYDPVADAVTDAQAAFVDACRAGATFGDALERAGPDLDLTATLALLLDRRAFTSLDESTAR